MAESFVFNVAEKVLEKLGSRAVEEVCLACDLERSLQKLKSTVSTIHAVLLDAEKKQAKNLQLTDWLGKIKDALYDAEDVVDEFDYEASWSQVVNRGGIKTKVRHFFSSSNSLVFHFKMGHKIKEIREKLDEIAAEKDKFHLTERLEDPRVVHADREMTHSFVHPSDVVGRDVDKETIVRLLMQPGDGENVSIIPIVGIGGLGKTTLAKLVYNDERIVGHFELKMWVCVSENFDVSKLTKEIIESATGKTCDDLKIDLLQFRLRCILDNRRFLLILDDVWNNNRDKWIKLKDLLLGGACGSKIVVTTRNQLVASIVGTVPTYDLKGLSHEDCLSLFVKWAFKKGEEKQHPNLLKIGSEIVKKCKGVPLAVRTLGGLLFLKTDERDWLFIRDNEIWKLEQKENDILPELKLSYNEMPSYLKQCFVYCSIFPKDYVFNNYDLTQFWLAQGLLQSPDENQNWQGIGHQYIKELWSRSFFQDFKDRGATLIFQIHDLVHDFALSMAQNECLTINSDTLGISKKVRHVSFSGQNKSWEEVPNFLLEQKHLRTIFFPINEMGPTAKSFIETRISRFRYLRMLNLSNSSFVQLPSSIGKLKHLRYLVISKNCRIKKLPNSICKLQNLQTLVVSECSQLEELPRNIGNLISLRALEITTKQMFLPKEGIGRLISLRYLCIIGCGNLKSLNEWMQCLTILRILEITNCESLEESFLCSVKYLTALETLAIWNCEKIKLMEQEEDIQDLNLSLRSFFIGQLPQLVALPKWLQGAANTLQSIFIGSCYNLAALPEWMPILTSLEIFEIVDCPKLSVLPEGLHCLTTLRCLKITACPELSRRCQQGIGEDWPKIAHVPEITIDGKMIKSIYN